MSRREWYIVDSPVPWTRAHEAYQDYHVAKAVGEKLPIIKVVEDVDWDESEKEWSTPCDGEARTRPMVEVRQEEDEQWMPAILLAVRHPTIRSYPPGLDPVKYIAIKSGTDELWWNHCRIHKHEVELIYSYKKGKR
jgi:hypothetical protein